MVGVKDDSGAVVRDNGCHNRHPRGAKSNLLTRKQDSRARKLSYGMSCTASSWRSPYALCCWNVDVHNLVNSHIFDSFVKAWNHLTSHAGKCQWLVAIVEESRFRQECLRKTLPFYLRWAHETPIVKTYLWHSHLRVTNQPLNDKGIKYLHPVWKVCNGSRLLLIILLVYLTRALHECA